MVELLRERGACKPGGALHEQALKVAGLQILIAVAALGVDGRRTHRFFAAVTFSITLYVGWFYLVAIFDVAGSPRAAAKFGSPVCRPRRSSQPGSIFS